MLRVNAPLAVLLGLDPDALASQEGADVLSGNILPPGTEPIAMAYAGHQFGGWSPRLGDGRAILLGEVVGRDGVRRDIQLKGGGPTPFSRMGDGRAALGPVLREFILSEAMAALGVPTTRALAAVATGEAVLRETELPGAVLTRVATSHVRVGTFQYLAAQGDEGGVRALADYVVARHYPDAAGAAQPCRAMLDAIVGRVARLIARWQMIGFVHGVMNTDNMSVAGETIDYGPCAFMEAYDPATVFSSIDVHGRYAYCNQPAIAHWNLSRLAEALLPLLGPDDDAALTAAQDALAAFRPAFEAAWLNGMRLKLGLLSPSDDDGPLAAALLDAMHAARADFTMTFRLLCDGPAAARPLFGDLPEAFDAWAADWAARLSPGSRDAMRAANPAFIPRNHRVAAALAAADDGDLQPMDDLIRVLSHPYDDQPGFDRFQLPAEAARSGAKHILRDLTPTGPARPRKPVASALVNADATARHFPHSAIVPQSSTTTSSFIASPPLRTPQQPAVESSASTELMTRAPSPRSHDARLAAPTLSFALRRRLGPAAGRRRSRPSGSE